MLNAGILACTALVQLALMVFGYLSYHDFGWRIFKLFGIDFNMRQVYERFLWFMAMLKLDMLMAMLNVAAGFAFFFQHLVGILEYTLMVGGIGCNMLWVLAAYAAVKLEYRVFTTVLLPVGLISPAYLAYKAYDLYTVSALNGAHARTRSVAQARTHSHKRTRTHSHSWAPSPYATGALGGHRARRRRRLHGQVP